MAGDPQRLSDLDRIERLSVKLLHQLSDVRLRSARNLLSKFKSQLVDESIFSRSPLFYRNLLGHINDCLCLIIHRNIASFRDISQSDIECIDCLLALICHLSKFNSFLLQDSIVNVNADQTFKLDPVRILIDNLYRLQSMKDIQDTTSFDLIKQAIESMNIIHPKTPLISRIVQDSLHGDIIKAKPDIKKEVYSPNSVVNTMRKDKPATSISTNKRFSGILYSELAYHGWRLPECFVTEYDDKYLFESEVRVKLNHPNATSQLRDILCDFPVEVIFSRVGLLQTIFEAIGSLYLKDDLEADCNQISPLTLMHWCKEVILKAVRATRGIMSGDYYGYVPKSLESAERSIHDCTSASSHAMALQIYMMRYPRTYSSEEINQLSWQLANENPPTAIGGLPKAPSVAGFAFACCAISMSLLLSRDLMYANGAVDVIVSCLPYVLEPQMRKDEGGLDRLDSSRLQYLLNQIEQIIVSNESTVDVSTFFISLTNPQRNKDLQDDHGKRGSYVADCCYQSLLIRVLVELVTVCSADSYICKWSEEKSIQSGNLTKLRINSSCLIILKDLVILSNLSESFVDKHASIVRLLKQDQQENPRVLVPFDECNRIVSCASELSFLRSQENEYFGVDVDEMIDHLVRCVVESQTLLSIDFDGVFHDSDGVESHSSTDFTMSQRIDRHSIVVVAVILFVIESGRVNLKPSNLLQLTNLLMNILFSSAAIFRCLAMDCLIGFISFIGDSSSSNEIIYLSKIENFPGTKFLLDELSKVSKLQVLRHLTSSIDFLYGFVVLNILENKNMEGSSLTIQVSHKSIQLTRLLLNFAFKDNVNSRLDHSWFSLLIPLSLLILKFQSEDKRLQNSDSIVHFYQFLQDYSRQSDDQRVRGFHGASVILGLFHIDSIIRQQSFSILRYSLPIDQGRDGIVDDPFEAQPYNSMTLTKLLHVRPSSTAQTPKSSGKIVFSHEDVRKLFSISIDNTQQSLRITATLQLLQMFQTDVRLLLTAEKLWLRRSIGSIIQVVAKTILSLNVLSDEDLSQREADALSKLLLFILQHSRTARELVNVDLHAFQTYSEAEDSPVSIATLLRAVFTNIDRLHSEETKLSLFQIIAIVALTTKPIEDNSRFCIVGDGSDSSLMVSAMFFETLGFPSSNRNESSSIPMIVAALSKLKDPIVKVNESVEVLRKMLLSPTSRTCESFNEIIVEEMNSSKSHRQMNECLRCAFSVFIFNSTLISRSVWKSCVSSDSVIMKVLNNLPRFQKDVTTFLHTVQIATKLFDCKVIACSESDFDIHQSRIVDNICSVSKKILVGDVNQSKESSLSLDELLSVLSGYLALLSSLMATMSPDDSFNFVQTEKIAFVFDNLLEIAYLERIPSIYRSECLSVAEKFVEILRRSPTSVIQCISNFQSADLKSATEIESANSWKLLLKILNMIRSPDSWRGHSVCFAGMLLFHHILDDQWKKPILPHAAKTIVNFDLKWLVRAVYHRHARFKSCALQIIRRIVDVTVKCLNSKLSNGCFLMEIPEWLRYKPVLTDEQEIDANDEQQSNEPTIFDVMNHVFKIAEDSTESDLLRSEAVHVIAALLRQLRLSNDDGSLLWLEKATKRLIVSICALFELFVDSSTTTDNSATFSFLEDRSLTDSYSIRRHTLSTDGFVLVVSALYSLVQSSMLALSQSILFQAIADLRLPEKAVKLTRLTAIDSFLRNAGHERMIFRNPSAESNEEVSDDIYQLMWNSSILKWVPDQVSIRSHRLSKIIQALSTFFECIALFIHCSHDSDLASMTSLRGETLLQPSLSQNITELIICEQLNDDIFNLFETFENFYFSNCIVDYYIRLFRLMTQAIRVENGSSAIESVTSISATIQTSNRLLLLSINMLESTKGESLVYEIVCLVSSLIARQDIRHILLDTSPNCDMSDQLSQLSSTIVIEHVELLAKWRKLKLETLPLSLSDSTTSIRVLHCVDECLTMLCYYFVDVRDLIINFSAHGNSDQRSSESNIIEACVNKLTAYFSATVTRSGFNEEKLVKPSNSKIKHNVSKVPAGALTLLKLKEKEFPGWTNPIDQQNRSGDRRSSSSQSNVWRSRVRGYRVGTVSKPAANTVQNSADEDIEDCLRSALLLTSIMKKSLEGQRAVRRSLEMSKAATVIDRMIQSFFQYARQSSNSRSIASHERVALVLGSFLIAFIHDNQENKLFFVMSHVAYVSERSIKPSSSSGMISMLLSRSLESGLRCDFRHMTLQLTLSLLATTVGNIVNPSTLSALLLSELRRILNLVVKERQPRIDSLLVDMLTETMVKPPSSSSTSIGYRIHSDLNEENMNRENISLSKMLPILLEEAEANSDLSMSVCRLIGRLADNSKSSDSLVLIIDESVIEFLIRLIARDLSSFSSASGAEIECSLAWTALWTLLHSNEQAKTTLNTLLKRSNIDGSRSNDILTSLRMILNNDRNSSDLIERAKLNLRSIADQSVIMI